MPLITAATSPSLMKRHLPGQHRRPWLWRGLFCCRAPCHITTLPPIPASSVQRRWLTYIARSGLASSRHPFMMASEPTSTQLGDDPASIYVPLPSTRPSSRAPSLARPVEIAASAPKSRGALKPGVTDGQEPHVSSCKCAAAEGRNLVVCIDGTSNQFSENNTNVVELYSRLVKDNRQLTFYNSGIGTYATPSWKSLSYYMQQILNKLDLAFALRFEKIIISAYAWLADNYQPNDRIFLFGFSRGAYQVRALSAMIDLLGLIHKGNDDQIPFAYELYAAGQNTPSGRAETRAPLDSTTAPISTLPPITERPPESASPDSRQETPSQEAGYEIRSTGNSLLRAIQRTFCLPATTKEDVRSMQKRFKKAFARDVNVHFVGVWDTVSSVGVARAKTLPGTTNGMEHVCYFRHALAIHEYRVKFLPEYVNGGFGPRMEGPVPKPGTANSEPVPAPDAPPTAGGAAPRGDRKDEQPSRPRSKEVWFSGSHSDIGGGSTKNPEMNKFGASLRWMSFEARVAGARFTLEPMFYGDAQLPHTYSLTSFWWLLETIPFRRLTYEAADGATYMPHLGSRRVFQRDQLVSWGVSDHVRQKYGLEDMEIEKDPYTDAEKFLRHLEGMQNKTSVIQEDLVDFRESLRSVVRSVPGQQSLRGVHPQIIQKLLQVLEGPEVAKDEVRHLISAALFGLAFAFDGTDTSGVGRDPSQAAGDFFEILADHISSSTPLDTRHEEMLLVLKSLEGGRAALRKQTSKVVAAVHGAILISDEEDSLFKVVQTLVAIDGVICVFDSKGRITDRDKCDMIAAGCALFAIIEKRVQARQLLTTKEHELLRVLRKSDRYAIGTLFYGLKERIWHHLLSLLHLCTELSEGQNSSVAAPAIAKDVQYILDGFSFVMSWDFCDFRKLSSLLHPDAAEVNWTVPEIWGHKRAVTAVSFLPAYPDLRIASASWDGSVRIWDPYTGRDVSPSLMKHDEDVNCLSVSLNHRIVSGSDGGVCIVWDADTGREITRSPALGSIVYAVAISADGERVVAGTHDGDIHTFAVRTEPEVARLEGHDSSVLSVCFSPGRATTLASSSLNSTLLWDLETRTSRRLEGQNDWVRTISFTPDGRFLAAGTDDGHIIIWAIESMSATPLRDFVAVHDVPGPRQYVYSVKYAPNGRHIVSASGDGLIRLYNADTGEADGEELQGHREAVLSVDVSADGTRIVSGSEDRTLHVWDRVPFLKDSVVAAVNARAVGPA